MTIVNIDTSIDAPLLQFDFVGGVYQRHDREMALEEAGLILDAGGGIALAPDGSLRQAPIGQPRRFSDAGLLLEPASQNKLAMFNFAPTSTAGWFKTPNTAALALTLVDDSAALYAAQDPSGAYIFRALMDAGTMNGMVLDAVNNTGAEAYIISNSGARSVDPHCLSAYVRCLAGTGDIRMFGSATGDTFSGAAWRRVICSVPAPNPAQNRQLVIALQPGARVRVIGAQMEPLAYPTSPIVVTGAAAARGADRMALIDPALFAQPVSILLNAWMQRADGVARCLLSASTPAGIHTDLVRRSDGALSITPIPSADSVGSEPRFRNVFGPGGLRVGLRLGRRRAAALAGWLVHDPWRPTIAGLDRLEIGNTADLSQPFIGWIRLLQVVGDYDDTALSQLTAHPSDGMPLDFVRYVSRAGSDTADGKSPATAWGTVAKVNASAFPPGSFILFERGGDWNEALTAQPYCTYGAYGSGPRPIIGSADSDFAVQALGSSGVRLEDLDITRGRERGIDIFGFNWMSIARCRIHHTGTAGSGSSQGLVFAGNGRDVFPYGFALLDSSIDNVEGDDIYMQYVRGPIIVDNVTLLAPTGEAADGFQVFSSPDADIILRNAAIDMKSRPTASGKGAATFQNVRSALVEDSELIGINFCLSLLTSNFAVRRNKAHGARLNDYSWGIGISGTEDIRDGVIEYNEIEDCNRALAISAENGDHITGPMRADIVARRNIARNCGVGLFIDRPTSGQMVLNQFIDCTTPVSVAADMPIPPGQATSLALRLNGTA